jgi:hypothetical protein
MHSSLFFFSKKSPKGALTQISSEISFHFKTRHQISSILKLGETIATSLDISYTFNGLLQKDCQSKGSAWGGSPLLVHYKIEKNH